MKTPYLLFTMMTAALITSGCKTASSPSSHPTQVAANFMGKQHVLATTQDKYPAKNPLKVAVYNQDKTPHAPYRVIGVAKVSKYSQRGVKREEAAMHNIMKKLAASIGGDGIVDIDNNEDTLQGKVIAFQKILI